MRRKLSLPDVFEAGDLSARISERRDHALPRQAYLAALDATSDAVLIVDRGGVVQYVNRAGLSLLARDRSEQRTLGRHLLGLASVDGAALRKIIRGLQHASSWQGTLQVEFGARGSHAIELCVCRVAHDVHAAQSFSIVARLARPSAVPSRAASALATQSQLNVLSTVARVASEMAHDFNNQIAVVLNYSFILLRELPHKSPMRDHVSELQSAAWRAAEVAREILRFGARRNLEATDVDVGQLLRSAQAILCSMFGDDGRGRSQTSIELRLPDEPCRVRARRAQLEWLVLELSARLRNRLGQLQRLRLSASTARSGNRTDEPRILIALDAHPVQLSPFATCNATLSDAMTADQGDTQAAAAMRAAERALPHARGELTTHVLPDGGLRYLICLPAVRG